METLARLGVATLELFEAEVRALRRHLIRLAIAVACAGALLILGALGVIWLLYGVFLLLSQYMLPSYAALTMGGAAILFAAAGVTFIKERITSDGQPNQ